MKEYQKIYGPFNRSIEGPNRNKVIEGDWSRPEFGELAGLQWEWTEKVDGTNIRIGWDGHKVEFGGRTERAQIPANLVTVLRDLFTEELFEQTFGDSAVTLYGEGYGAGIQKGGGNYRAGVGFVLFDVRVGDWWLLRGSVEDIARKMGIHTVPIRYTGTVMEAIQVVRLGLWSSYGKGDFHAEGLVGRTASGLLTRAGERIMMKIKRADFFTDPQ